MMKVNAQKREYYVGEKKRKVKKGGLRQTEMKTKSKKKKLSLTS